MGTVHGLQGGGGDPLGRPAGPAQGSVSDWSPRAQEAVRAAAPGARPARPLGWATGGIARMIALAWVAAACGTTPSPPTPPTTTEQGRIETPEVAGEPGNRPDDALAEPTGESDGGVWTVLFDGRDLSQWRLGVFGEDPEFEQKESGLVLPQGVPLAGLTYTGELPVAAYTLEVEATKEYGSDFFLGVTFPVRGTHLTLVLGGWGGVVCGLSCLDGEDASENDTRVLRSFPNGKPVSLSIDVSDERIVARVDGDTIVDVALEGRELSMRPEVEPSVPLGIASFSTCTTLHQVRIRGLRPPVTSLDADSVPR